MQAARLFATAGVSAVIAAAAPAGAREARGVVPVSLTVEPTCRVTVAVLANSSREKPRPVVACNAEAASVLTVIEPAPSPPRLRRAVYAPSEPPPPPRVIQIDF